MSYSSAALPSPPAYPPLPSLETSILPPQATVTIHPRQEEDKEKKLTTDPSPSVNEDKITDNETAKSWINSYLAVGEMVMDQSVAVMSSIAWFERKR